MNIYTGGDDVFSGRRRQWNQVSERGWTGDFLQRSNLQPNSWLYWFVNNLPKTSQPLLWQLNDYCSEGENAEEGSHPYNVIDYQWRGQSISPTDQPEEHMRWEVSNVWQDTNRFMTFELIWRFDCLFILCSVENVCGTCLK